MRTGRLDYDGVVMEMTIVKGKIKGKWTKENMELDPDEEIWS